ncbi:MAG: protein translocase SEC61 complex subunit gamma [Candidatus Marsarchaeota archaeon]|jgi:protein translocase SEC61 complex gamma subunit|nr:protein translocase SEC61 complex subunit gamma [Candidatus Marsarchaeota archaeon]MCL5420006.1 protein translocase SEC61 complex subunit gamma [Candidatus Marsarchaeota archaeon]
MQLNPIKSLRGFWADARHVLSVSYRPDMDTFKRTLKIVLLGVMILGVLGFIIFELISLFA